jgi:hypothetical protein
MRVCFGDRTNWGDFARGLLMRFKGFGFQNEEEESGKMPRFELG